MGTIKIVSNADYSTNAVGKVDFNTGIFRRKVDGKLERNVAWLNLGYINGYDKVDLSADVIKVRTSFVFGRHSGGHRTFSVSDYTTQRSFMVSHLKGVDEKLLLQFWFMSGTTAYAMNLNTGPAPIDNTDYNIEYVIDFKNKVFLNITINGNIYNMQPITTTTYDAAWTNGQTRTICFGEVANYQNNPTVVSRAFPYFGQVSDINDNILLHVDFLGDNTSEILTDKARGIILSKTAEVTIKNMPLEI